MIAYPADLKRSLPARLPGRPYVDVVARDANERRCPAYAADHWELIAYYVDLGHDLDALADALFAVDGVYMTLTYRPGTEDFGGWPVTYRSTDLWRPQVRALMQVVDR